MNESDPRSYSYDTEYAAAKQDFFISTYKTMAAGLFLTFAVALIVVRFFPNVAYSAPAILFFCIAELVTVVLFSRRIATASYSSARGMFFFYAALSGITFSSVFLCFDIQSVFLCFFASACAFALMAFLGATTMRDLSPMSRILYGGLLGLLLVTGLSLLFRFSGLDILINAVGIVLFMGMTAYDSQKLGQMFDQVAGTEIADRYSLFAALQLYLDFVNLFMYLLSFMGKRDRR